MYLELYGKYLIFFEVYILSLEIAYIYLYLTFASSRVCAPSEPVTIP